MIAVSGAKGFIGSALVSALRRKGPVISIVRGDGLSSDGNNLEVGSNYSSLRETLQHVRVFINAAGSTKGGRSVLQDGNISSTKFFITVIPEGLTQVIHISTANLQTASEGDYEGTKAFAEGLWQDSMFKDRLTIIRPTWVYGPGDRRNTERLIRSVIRYRILPVPAQLLRPVYIDDLTALCYGLVDTPGWIGCTCLVSGQEVTSFKQMVEIIASLLQKQILCIPVPGALLSPIQAVMGFCGFSRQAQRLNGWRADKTWHDPAVWELLPRESTRLIDGLSHSVENVLLSAKI
jgi:nucleoside-diphosphate-sugar epimerase